MEFTKDVKVRQEKFGAVVFETLREKVFVTNEVGGEILHLLSEGKELPDVVADLVKNYNGDATIIREDVQKFISLLKEKGIIK